MYVVSRRFVWDAGHRVLGHGGKCRHLHGHRYEAKVVVSPSYTLGGVPGLIPPSLDKLGMVVDFSVLKDQVGKWIDENWDHNLILHPDDPLLMAEQEVRGNTSLIGQENADGVFAGKMPYIMPQAQSKSMSNPTAENLARVLFQEAQRLLPGLKVVSVSVKETENCEAEYAGN